MTDIEFFFLQSTGANGPASNPSSFPEIKTWLETIEKRPAVHKGMNVPDDFSKMKEIMKNKEAADEYAKKSSGWIMKGMKDEEDKEKKSQI